MLFGVLNIRKPSGMTSRDVVNRVVRCCPRKTKVGHAGTLDPMATGVLVVAVGPATKLIQFSQNSTKSYVGKFQLGLRSNTEDATGIVEEIPNVPLVDEDTLRSKLPQFQGIIPQTPPQFSAVKVDGKRAYQLARQGEIAEIKPRLARIDSIEAQSFNYPYFSLKIDCGKGTYIRTLGRDIAKSLGSDSIMTELNRTAVGKFIIEESSSLDDIENGKVETFLLDPIFMVDALPRIQLAADEIEKLRHGKPLCSANWNLSPDTTVVAGVINERQVAAVLERRSIDSFATKVNFVPQMYS